MDEIIKDTDIIDTTKTDGMTAGEMLRNARTTGRRKREMQTIAKQLCIREDFLQALEYGMPEASGNAMGVDRLIMLISGAEKLNDTVWVPCKN